MIPISDVTVLGRTYTIKEDSTLTDEGDDGSVNHRTLEIRIAPGLSFEDFRETVAHEVDHIIEYRVGVVISHKALQMMSVQRDIFLAANPDFTALYGGDNGRSD